MVTAIDRVLIFLLARDAKGKVRHDRIETVIGKIMNDRIARTTLRAVDEGIAVTPILRVFEFNKTALADSLVLRHHSIPLVISPTFKNLKALKTLRGYRLRQSNKGDCQRGSLIDESLLKGLEIGYLALDVHLDGATIIKDPATKSEIFCETGDKRPKANALNPPFNQDPKG
jgi:hypothetical protein